LTFMSAVTGRGGSSHRDRLFVPHSGDPSLDELWVNLFPYKHTDAALECGMQDERDLALSGTR